MTRRQFAGVSTMSLQAMAQTPGAKGLPTRRLGRSNEQVSILGLGGAHIGRVGQKDRAEAIRMMHFAIDNGITFFDNAWDYHDGFGEEMMGLGLEGGWRKRVFLMTKNCERDYQGSLRNLDDSLRRLKTDHIDLWQFHEMNYDNAPDWVFEKGGIRAAQEAVKAGKVRYVGFTGHKDPRIHLKMLAKPFDWVSSQMPINVMDAFYRSFQREVVPVCLRNDVGVIGMKSLGGGPMLARIPSKGGVSAEDCVRYALSLPVSTLVRGYMTMDQLKADIAIARDFKALSVEEREAILAKARVEASDGRHELFKSTQTFDGVTHRRQHGFDAGA